MAERILTLSWQHPRYGYRRIRALLVKEGWAASRKFVQAVRRSSGLQVKPPKKRRPRQGISTGLPTKASRRNHVWSWDFVHDRTDNGGMLKMMTLIDEYTRKCLRIRVARQLTSTDVLSVLSETIDEEGVPSYIRSDNGSECLNREVLLSVAEAQVLIEQWRQTYNNEHPHSRLGFKSPQEFVRFLSALGRVRAMPSLRQDLSYTSILKPLTPGNSFT